MLSRYSSGLKVLSLLPVLLCLALPTYGESEAEGLLLVDRALAEAVTEDALEKREHEGDELFYLHGSHTPFTGWVTSLDPGGRIEELSQYEDGRQGSLQIGYWHELGILDLMWPSLTLAMTAGYDTHYIFRGETFGEDAVWSAIDMSAPLMDGIAVSGGAFYVSSSDGEFDFDKLNLFTSVGAVIGIFDTELGYVVNLFPGSSNDDTSEVQFGIGTSVGELQLGGAYVYNFDTEAHYFDALVGVGLDFSGAIRGELDLLVALNESEYSHSFLRASLPIGLSDFVHLTPYIAGIFRNQAEWADESEGELIGGALLSVSF